MHPRLLSLREAGRNALRAILKHRQDVADRYGPPPTETMTNDAFAALDMADHVENEAYARRVAAFAVDKYSKEDAAAWREEADRMMADAARLRADAQPVIDAYLAWSGAPALPRDTDPVYRDVAEQVTAALG